MSLLRYGYVTGPILGVLWAFVMATTLAVLLSFTTGEAFRPGLWGCLVLGALVGLAAPENRVGWLLAVGAAVLGVALSYTPVSPIHVADTVGLGGHLAAGVGFGVGLAWPVMVMMAGAARGALNRHEWEEAVIRFLTGFGYIFFTAIVAIPFYVMVMTSLKTQGELIANPLDFSIDLSQGWDLFRSYSELFRDFNFGQYMWTSFYVSVLTVFITLAFSIPGAYAVARLKFRGQKSLSRSILLIYMVPMIVLALPIYIVFSMTGLRNSITGIVMIYPVTTIPVALYMLQGYFRGLPGEVEEAGLMDGLNRLQVIWKITLPLSLPALASVSLYVFMIAWNEFLLAFMLLDDPSKFTLTRGIASLNSSEIPRQHLMAGAVIATVPVMALFLGLEKFMTRGLTAGSVKG
ncbi:Inner membrane ABC transporter permease protein YcjP [Roseibacterium elongatum DSM 19469]|uniref:Inner membrane ABC transporter permease protein YcjP n=1 Tax=Roseicyclus elongatus DSM 19469 TaxID=1294273 RepID=W8RXX8_9RHOB|nr:carbohydrate ABC transporter permease [Roseibacterium elongatum]AHM02687.1 Inner membrane ABC transporter permease protein YcjP [Roseibacterium elongatum DSM 19469]